MAIEEREGVVTVNGDPVTLVGPEVKEGDDAPVFRVVDGEFKQVRLSDFRGKVCLISAVPSLDTGVCALQTKRFNEEMQTFPQDVVVMTVSMDLPFAQKRFCDAEKTDRIKLLSDHVWREFGLNYGILIKNMGLLARSVFVIGRDGRIAYKQIVSELSEHPDYDTALQLTREEVSR